VSKGLVNSPFFSISSAWVPVSTIWPPSRTISRSALRSVESRWAMADLYWFVITFSYSAWDPIQNHTTVSSSAASSRKRMQTAR
jgi:hypothetical protein